MSLNENQPAHPVSKTILTPKQCAEQFRMYARANADKPGGKHYMNFCADFLDEFCLPARSKVGVEEQSCNHADNLEFCEKCSGKKEAPSDNAQAVLQNALPVERYPKGGISGRPDDTRSLYEQILWELENAAKILQNDGYICTPLRIQDLIAKAHVAPSVVSGVEEKRKDLGIPGGVLAAAHALQKALEPFARLASMFDVEPYAKDYPNELKLRDSDTITYHNFLTLGHCRNAKAAIKLLSSHSNAVLPHPVSESPVGSTATGVEDEEIAREVSETLLCSAFRIEELASRNRDEFYQSHLTAIRKAKSLSEPKEQIRTLQDEILRLRTKLHLLQRETQAVTPVADQRPFTPVGDKFSEPKELEEKHD